MVAVFTTAPLASLISYVYGVAMAAPLFVMMKVASPALEVQTPLAESTGAGGITHVLISATAFKALSFGLSSV